MALTVAEQTAAGRPVWFVGQPRGFSGNQPFVMKVVQVTFDSSYAAGGESLTATDVGFASIVAVFAGSASGYVFSYDTANQKLLAYRGDWDNAADAPLAEVANAVDLSAVTVRALIVGTEAS